MTYHIPDEVVEAAGRAVLESRGLEWGKYGSCLDGPTVDAIEDARAAITAALAAWVKCGMAKGGSGYIESKPIWVADTDITRKYKFPVIIIRTEAPQT